MVSYFSNDTIVQIASPFASSSYGIIRISGSESFKIIKKIFVADLQYHNKKIARGLYKGKVIVGFTSYINNSYQTKDYQLDSYLLSFPAPHSYTKEDSAELHVHGNLLILKALLKTIISFGAREALPGEFTYRGFIYGRISLTQAEAVEKLITAKNRDEYHASLELLAQDVNKVRRDLSNDILKIIASLEASLDFSEEDLEEISRENFISQLKDIITSCDKWSKNISRTSLDNDKVKVSFIGLTNAGKSSLINKLLETPHQIVSPNASTTKDHISVLVNWQGLSFLLEDTPGYDPSGSEEGVALSQRLAKKISSTNAQIFVVDQSKSISRELIDFIKLISGEVVLVFNKLDQKSVLIREELVSLLNKENIVVTKIVFTSYYKDETIKELRGSILDLVNKQVISGNNFNLREANELEAIAHHCRLAIGNLARDEYLELALEDLHLAYQACARLNGKEYSEEILNNIFSKFCLGK